MEKITDWAKLWRDLAGKSFWNRADSGSSGGDRDPWKKRARDFDAGLKNKGPKPDIFEKFLASQVDPSMTVLDIGAGTGRWSFFLAKRVTRITALDPSKAMLEVLRENLVMEGAKNIDVVEGAWPETDVSRHDVVLCSHAMYSSPDLPLFVRRMVDVAEHSIYMLFRAPAPDGVMGEVAQHLWGQPHDSANFIVGYNVLLDMGILPNVMVSPTSRPWTSPDISAALADLKRRFGLENVSEHDEYLTEVLSRKLKWLGEQYVWPDGMRSVLVYWRKS